MEPIIKVSKSTRIGCKNPSAFPGDRRVLFLRTREGTRSRRRGKMDHDNADAAAAPPIRLVNFISEEELDQAKKTRGERVDDGTAQRDKPLYEILKENKDRKDAEFNERFKHRPPKALDEDETEFLDNLEMSRRKYERQLADEEAQQLRSFQDAVAARSSIVHELKETPAIARAEEKKPVAKRSQDARPGHLIISVKPQAKKAKIDAKSDKSSVTDGSSNGQVDEKPPDVASVKAVGGLVSYSDESDDD
ncbi:uncharacterized protein [Elaeis guineensis]|uniref:uncharacterized protein isoform X2 n=1 Tax=Elaeis guineensis var. tenera TaxID=51953 RepID=UPI003C6CFF43